MLASFNITPGTGDGCGASFLRNAEREFTVEAIKETGSVEMYRAKMAQNLMQNTNSHNSNRVIKPPLIRSSRVLHQAVSTARKKNYLDENPIVALDKMKYTTHLNSIYDISYSPFSADYFPALQLHAYKRVHKKYGGVTLCVDSTGVKVAEIKRNYCNEKRALFLYLAR